MKKKKKKQVLYSFLREAERGNLIRAIHDQWGDAISLSKTKESAKKNRKYDFIDYGYKPGPIVKITLETVKD